MKREEFEPRLEELLEDHRYDSTTYTVYGKILKNIYTQFINKLDNGDSLEKYDFDILSDFVFLAKKTSLRRKLLNFFEDVHRLFVETRLK